MNQIAFAEQDSIHRVGRTSADLGYPESIRSRTDAGDLDVPCRQIDEEQNQETLQTFPGPDFHAKEIRRYDRSPVLCQKLFPTRLPATLRRRFDAVQAQNLRDRAHGKFVSHIRERALDTSVSPNAILLGQADYQVLDFFSNMRSTRSALGRAIVLLCNQFAMPVQQSVRHHQGVQLGECFATQNFSLTARRRR